MVSVEVILYCSSGLERGRSGISVGEMGQGRRGCCAVLVNWYGILHLVLYC